MMYNSECMSSLAWLASYHEPNKQEQDHDRAQVRVYASTIIEICEDVSQYLQSHGNSEPTR